TSPAPAAPVTRPLTSTPSSTSAILITLSLGATGFMTRLTCNGGMFDPPVAGGGVTGGWVTGGAGGCGTAGGCGVTGGCCTTGGCSTTGGGAGGVAGVSGANGGAGGVVGAAGAAAGRT